MNDPLLELFLDLVSVPSPSGREAAVAARVATYLRDLGLTPFSDGAFDTASGACGNLFAFLPATAPGYPVLLLNAHLDTVVHDEPIQYLVEEDQVCSGGPTILGADDKSGVALILLALRRLLEQNLPHGDLWVVFTVQEEIGLCGAQALDYSLLQPWPELGFVLDGGRTPGEMTIAAPSAVALDVRITGRAAHAGVHPEQGLSAIAVAAQAISAMRLGRLDEETTANVGTISGGSARNIVPEVCVLQAEARSHREEKLAAQVAHMEEQFEAAAQAAGAQLALEVSRSYTAFALAADSAPVLRGSAAARAVGLEPATKIGGGGSDANVFNERGIPSLMLPTGAADPHTPEERLLLPAAHQCLEWLVAIITSG